VCGRKLSEGGLSPPREHARHSSEVGSLATATLRQRTASETVSWSGDNDFSAESQKRQQFRRSAENPPIRQSSCDTTNALRRAPDAIYRPYVAHLNSFSGRQARPHAYRVAPDLWPRMPVCMDADRSGTAHARGVFVRIPRVTARARYETAYAAGTTTLSPASGTKGEI
jgi:hypothetical protein